MEPRVIIKRGWTCDEVTACCPDLPGVSATARTEKEALELLRREINDHQIRAALVEHAQQAAEELARRVAAERAAAPAPALRRPRLHSPRVAEPDSPEPSEPVAAPPSPEPRPAPAPSPMRVGPSIDQCIATLVRDVLRHRDLN